VKVANCRPAQFQGFRGKFAAALAGEEGRDILAGGGQGREVVPRAPAAPGSDRRPVGTASVFGFGQATVDVGGVAFARKGSVDDRLAGFDGGVEPGSNARGGRSSAALSSGSLLASTWLSKTFLRRPYSSPTRRFYPTRPTIDNSIYRR
jgi:hypothetical protein